MVDVLSAEVGLRVHNLVGDPSQALNGAVTVLDDRLALCRPYKKKATIESNLDT